MKKGYGVFGKAYEIMLKNDLHNPNSIDHKLIREMILLEDDSYHILYDVRPTVPDMKTHNLYAFAKSFKGNDDATSIQNILNYTSKIASDYNLSFEEMKFGGTEQEILKRGTDWCADMSRVVVVLLNCLNIPARIIHLANSLKAYNGHVVVEAFYEGKYGVIDPIYGYRFYKEKPLDAYALMNNPTCLIEYEEEYRDYYKMVAISEYNPMDPNNDYTISGVNDYTKTILSNDHKGLWMMGEDD